MALFPERVHPAVPAVVLAGFVALLGAETLPWVHATVPGGAGDSVDGPTSNTLYLAQVGPWQSTAYQLSWSVLLALVVVAAMVTGSTRRVVAAAALGWAAAQLAMLVGLVGEAARGGGLFTVPVAERGSLTPELGLYAAFLALGLLMLAALLLARGRPQRTAENAIELADRGDDAPLDLTVTSLPSHGWSREESAKEDR
jgi:hypothetical protein